MKKIKILTYASACALLSLVGFSACSSGDAAATALDQNPDVIPSYEGESVKTQFAISLPENIKMRMASTTVQESGFRGIDNIKLVPYSLGTAAATGVTANATANANLLALSALTAFDNENSNSKVYADVNLEIGTSNFLFYGKAVDNEAGTPIQSAADKFKFGDLTVTGLTEGVKPTLSSVEFTPVKIYGDGTDAEKTAINAGKTVGTNLVAALNAVANATPTIKLSDNTQPKFKEVTAGQSATINALWNSFKEITTGSSKNIEWVFKELYMNLDGLSTQAAQATVPDGYKMAVAIRTAIENYCTISSTSGVTTAVTLKDDYTGYPASVNLPDGAVRVRYNATNKEFEAVAAMSYASSMDVASLESYVYPANLQYFVNSPVKVSNNVQSPNYGDNSWSTILGLYDGTAVTADTRSVAITNQVQYGVARLDTKVNGLLAAGDANKYYDYAGNEVDVTNGFQLTGILIGSQKSVGWNYVPKGTAAYTIYDKAMSGTTAASMTVKREQPTTTNYTLVLQTGETDDEKTVNIALEFVNNCPDFVGADGEIIPNGATFYLVGTLKPSEATNKDAAVAAAKDRIFTQDFKTIANFTIKKGTATPNNSDGLGTATKGLPDLRVPLMELGLSVNLEWQPGLEFNVEI